ncbi:MAG: hypothetical protein SGJ20_06330, partial [Planctomycetota bacterium]|nr:hypothetical protein [Planctomycetota bacterium]
LVSTHATTQSDFNIWAAISDPLPESTTETLGADHYFRHQLKSTLGYLNKSYGDPATSADVGGNAQYVGSPKKPFPLIRWNNRPFANVYELMEVPASSAARLGMEFSVGANSYGPLIVERHFSHLLNFFEPNSGFSRVLELIHIPSKFVGSETIFHPMTFFSGAAGTELYKTPFNSISSFREPGKININTVTSRLVFRGLMPHLSATEADNLFNQLVGSRRGTAGSTVTMLDPVPGMPSIVNVPFRAASEADLVPPVPTMSRKSSQVTLLRSVDGTEDTEPLFAQSPSTQYDYNNGQRNAAFRYQGIERISNLVTTRSNVYAVWVTVGFFEVTPGVIDEGHPDGYRLGAELGSDTGEVKRHRGFYLLDRSIPVGFDRGQNLNVDRAIMLKRFIE